MKKIKQPKHPTSAQREYYRNLRRYSETYISLMRAALKSSLPELKDVGAEEQPRLDVNIQKKIAAIIDLVDVKMSQQFPDEVLLRWAMSMIGQVNKHTKRQINKMFEDQVLMADQEPDFIGLMKDSQLTPFFRNVAEENVGLIKSIPKMKQEAFKNNLVYMITQDQTSASIAKAIQDHFGLTRNRAKLIADDQVGKMAGRLEEYRQKQLGLKKYIWRTSGDERVRHDHKILDGKTFSWDKPPIVNRSTGKRGNPKQDYRCRCWAEPVFED